MSFSSFFNSIPFQFLLGGTLVAVITYLANNVSAKASAIVVAFPIGLLPMFFLKSQNKERRLSFDTTITNVLVVLTYLSLDFYLRQSKEIQKYGVVLAMATWAVLAWLLYRFSPDLGLKL